MVTSVHGVRPVSGNHQDPVRNGWRLSESACVVSSSHEEPADSRDLNDCFKVSSTLAGLARHRACPGCGHETQCRATSRCRTHHNPGSPVDLIECDRSPSNDGSTCASRAILFDECAKLDMRPKRTERTKTVGAGETTELRRVKPQRCDAQEEKGAQRANPSTVHRVRRNLSSLHSRPAREQSPTARSPLRDGHLFGTGRPV